MFSPPFLPLQEIIPELGAIQGDEKNFNQQLKSVLIASVAQCQDVSWIDTGSLSPRQHFCWGMVVTFIKLIPVSLDTFDWIVCYDFVIAQLGQIFNAYCSARKMLGSSCLLSQMVTQEISNTASDDVIHYFQWVRDAQAILTIWQERFLQKDVNFDGVLNYASHHTPIGQLGQALCAQTAVVDYHDVQDTRSVFITHFDELNACLLKYIPGLPEAQWCTLPSLLAYYGVSLPHHIQDTIFKHVLFPGDQKQLEGALTLCKLPATSSGQFQPGHDISLKLTKAMTLRKLLELLQDIMAWLHGIQKHLDMLVFFHLQKSEIFMKHLLQEAAKSVVVSLERSTESSSSFSLPYPRFQFPTSASSSLEQSEQDSGVTPEMLEQALEHVHNLIYRLAAGTATYADIVAGGVLRLESLNIQRELEIFTQYARHTGMAHIEGLAGIQSMLELLQVTHHIDMIHCTCKQYQLKGCLTDPTLNQLIAIAEESLTKLTLVDAMKKV